MSNNILQKILCQATIWLDEKGNRSTYCMLELGHTGKHSILSESKDEVTKNDEVKECTEESRM